jgi:hypothetical protein
MPHVDDGLLHEYLDGELTGAARDDLLAHLVECAPCRTRLEEERALMTRAGELLARAAPIERTPAALSTLARPRAPRWRIPAAWAASVTIAFMAGWYAQGERPGTRDGFEPATPQETKVPVPKIMKPLGRSRAGAPAPPAAAAKPYADEFDRLTTRQAAPAAATEPAAPRSEVSATAEQQLDADAAYALLGRAPALLPGRPVRRMVRSPTDADVVLIEQEWRPGVVLRLYERRAISAGMDATRDDTPRSSSLRASQAPSAQAALRGENLARYVNSLRVEIAGPLASDSLARLLDSVE